MPNDAHSETIAHLKRSTKLRTDERPKGWSCASPYYTPRFAEELKPHLDHLIANPDKEIVLQCDKLYLKTSTVFQRVYQGWRYLIDREDPDGRYGKLRTQISIKKEGRNIKLSWDKGVTSLVALQATAVDKASMSWRNQLVEYVESECDTMPPLSRQDLILSQEDLDWLSAYLGGLDTLIATIAISEKGYKIVKNKALAIRLKADREKHA